MLVMWNVDYLAVAIATSRQYYQLLLEWNVELGDDADQAHCWVLRDRALDAHLLWTDIHHRTTWPAVTTGYASTRSLRIGTARILRTA